MSIIAARAAESERRVTEIGQFLIDAGVPDLLGSESCIYATGSVGRGEASEHSDLDVFILKSNPESLSQLNSYIIRAHLIQASRAANFPDFSGDGEWLNVYRLDEMIDYLGSRRDDWCNTFTARILMVLEGRCLVGQSTYDAALRIVIREYWRDWGHNRDNFEPAFILNDLTKYWKVLCLEYAHKTSAASRAKATEEDKAKRRLDRFKLRHSRLLICFATIVAIAYAWRKGKQTISPEDMFEIAKKRPLARLSDIVDAERQDPILPTLVMEMIPSLLERYENFLEETNMPKPQLRSRFLDSAFCAAKDGEAFDFTARMFRLVREVLGDTRLFQYVVM